MIERASLDDLEDAPGAEVFDEPRTVRLRLEPGGSVAPHRHPGRTVVLHVVEGSMAVRVDGETHSLGTGELLRFDGDRAVEPSSEEGGMAVIVLAPHP